jgi:hypothetical protein
MRNTQHFCLSGHLIFLSPMSHITLTPFFSSLHCLPGGPQSGGFQMWATSVPLHMSLWHGKSTQRTSCSRKEIVHKIGEFG